MSTSINSSGRCSTPCRRRSLLLGWCGRATARQASPQCVCGKPREIQHGGRGRLAAMHGGQACLTMSCHHPSPEPGPEALIGASGDNVFLSRMQSLLPGCLGPATARQASPRCASGKPQSFSECSASNSGNTQPRHSPPPQPSPARPHSLGARWILISPKTGARRG